MEKVMDCVKGVLGKSGACLLSLIKTTAETAVTLAGKLMGKLGGCVCGKLKNTVSEHRQGVLLCVAAVTCLTSVVSMAAYLLGRRK